MDWPRSMSVMKLHCLLIHFVVLAPLSVLFADVPEPAGFCAQTSADDEWVVMVYNVENLFDIDGISLFEDYAQDASGERDAYDAERLLTKIDNHSQIIASCNGGRGPDIVALQELEIDFSNDPSFSLEQALEEYAEQTVAELLGGEVVSPRISGFPIEFFLLKRLRELGIDDYSFVGPRFDPSWQQRGIAHRCAFLSRFPVVEVRQHPLYQARDILEVTFDIHGNELTVFNNHWKSGASSVRTEPIRIQNAGVLRVLLDQLLVQNPAADILLVGDFNSHHNQSLRMDAPFGVTAINSILGSQSVEAALLHSEADLYNLWYELPQPERGSEVWMGEWGSLMQVIVTPGLYDSNGIQYVDNSFRRHLIPGVNVDAVTGEPIRWINLGSGAGYSDHIPVCASFRHARLHGKDSNLTPYHPDDLGSDAEQQHQAIWVNYSLEGREIYSDLQRLTDQTPDSLLTEMGGLFQVEGIRRDGGIEVDGKLYGLYAPKPEVWQWLKNVPSGELMRFVGEFSVHRAQLQFLIQDLSWVQSPRSGGESE